VLASPNVTNIYGLIIYLELGQCMGHERRLVCQLTRKQAMFIIVIYYKLFYGNINENNNIIFYDNIAYTLLLHVNHCEQD